MRYVAWIYNKMFGYDYPIRTTEFNADSFSQAAEKVYEADRFADVAALVWKDADVPVDFYALPEEMTPVIEQLAEQQGLSPEKVLLQALRLYQSTVNPVDLGVGGCDGAE